ncbi:MAG: 23S rRNA (adenine(2503)-C(2))-methyltransferase RlmN [Phycisphaerae bacterium]
MAIAPKQHLLGVTLEGFAAWLGQRGQPAYRARQVLEWVYRKAAENFEVMSNLPKPLRQELADHWEIYAGRVARRQDSTDGTTKLLLAWPDGADSECVLIPEERRNTACVSSQAGCPVGCAFCASGIGGLQRQLSAGQIVEQAMRVRQRAESGDVAGGSSPAQATGPDVAGRPGAHADIQTSRRRDDAGERFSGRALTNIVFMGSGEPLANYAQVLAAVRILNAEWGLNIGARRITLSTVGLPSQMMRLAAENLQVNLAVSLHAPDDALRRRIIPWADKIPLEDIVEAARYYFEKTGREITLEYILLAGVNDGPEHARRLVSLCRKMRCNVNLIRYNPVPGLPFERPTSFAAHQFKERLRARGVNAHLRKSRGRDIDAACGQLRRAARPAGATPG